MSGPRTRREWTTREQRQLSMMYGIESVAEIARRLGRTESSIQNRAHVLGLEAHNGRNARRKYCRATVKHLIAQGLSSAEIAQELGTSPQLIRWIARRDLPTPFVDQLRENGQRSLRENSNSWRANEEAR